MEATIKTIVGSALSALPGATLAEVHCRSTACKVAIDVTPDLKQKLVSTAPDGVAFATDEILARTGPLARAFDALWDDHQVAPLDRLLGSIRLFGLGDWFASRRYSRLLREETILMFDAATYDPSAYAAWVWRNRAQMDRARSK